MNETRRPEAFARLAAGTADVPVGTWDPADVVDGTPPLMGFLVIRGLLVRRVAVGGRFGAELVGRGDLISPLGADTACGGRAAVWRALVPSSLALLDDGFVTRLGGHPEMMSSLLSCALRRGKHAAVSIAIVHHPEIAVRVEMLFWDLATRWGIAHPDGMLVPLKLTHSLLADLVGAQRPSVSQALSGLAAKGTLISTEEGWLLNGRPPAELKFGVHTS